MINVPADKIKEFTPEVIKMIKESQEITKAILRTDRTLQILELSIPLCAFIANFLLFLRFLQRLPVSPVEAFLTGAAHTLIARILFHDMFPAFIKLRAINKMLKMDPEVIVKDQSK